MTAVKTFRDLIAWQKGLMLAQQIYRETGRFPNEERFGLTMQLRRSAVSVPSNIAEGYGRQSREDYIRYPRVARGSLMELQTQLLLAMALGFLAKDSNTIPMAEETDRVLQGLIRALGKTKKKGT